VIVVNIFARPDSEWTVHLRWSVSTFHATTVVLDLSGINSTDGS